MSENTDRLAQAAAAPRRARTAAGEIETHTLPDQIAADRYVSAKKITNPFLALRVGSFVPPNALGNFDRSDHLPQLPTNGR